MIPCLHLVDAHTAARALHIVAVYVPVPPWQYAKDLSIFKEVVMALPPPPGMSRPPLVIAADVDFIPLTGDFLFMGLLTDSARQQSVTWDVATWHFCKTH